MKKEDLDLERGDKDIVFIPLQQDTEKISEKEEPKKFLKQEMKEKGLEWENASIIGLFKDEFSLMLKENGEVKIDGETVYP